MARFIAFYLPQFHPLSENDKWWGKGFTEWTNVAKAKPLFPRHVQPHIPADLGFYDLRIPEVREAQAKLAREAGIEGFCYWHYWFGNGKQLLEKLFKDVVKLGKPDFPFCLAWANHSWERKTWDKNSSSEILIKQLYPGEQDYIDHFNTLIHAFRDPRYMKVDEKLLFFVFNPRGLLDDGKFIEIWRKLAKDSGLNDFYFIARDADSRAKDKYLTLGFDAIYNDDVFNIHHHSNKLKKALYLICREWLNIPTVFQYKKAIIYMVNDDCRNNNVVPLIAPNWDHSPRSGGKAIILHKSKPEYFKKIVQRALDIIKDKPKEKQLILIKSWNEWGEGNYMEPDLEFGKGNLEALRNEIAEFVKNSSKNKL